MAITQYSLAKDGRRVAPSFAVRELRWQKRIDWDKVKASGLVSGVMLKMVSANRKIYLTKNRKDVTT